MIPARFEYRRAGSAQEAAALLAQLGDEAKLLAGGHSLLPLMKLGLAQPSALIDLGGVRELDYIRDSGTELAIGALTRHHELATSELVRRESPLLAAAAAEVGDPQVRHRGTIGGSLAHADPAGDLPLAVTALDAVVVAEGPSGRREIAARDFFKSIFEPALRPDELLLEVRVPKTGSRPWAYEKFAIRAQDWAIVAVAAVRPNGATHVALGHMASTPLRATEVEGALAAGASASEAAALADRGTDPVSDLHASADYRRHLARVLTRRALAKLG